MLTHTLQLSEQTLIDLIVTVTFWLGNLCYSDNRFKTHCTLVPQKKPTLHFCLDYPNKTNQFNFLRQIH